MNGYQLSVNGCFRLAYCSLADEPERELVKIEALRTRSDVKMSG
jgi:hypothetical protein